MSDRRSRGRRGRRDRHGSGSSSSQSQSRSRSRSRSRGRKNKRDRRGGDRRGGKDKGHDRGGRGRRGGKRGRQNRKPHVNPYDCVKVDQMVRIGIDCGGVIVSKIDSEGNTDTSFLRGNHLETQPNQDTFKTIARLVSKFGADNVFIVSKCGDNVQRKTREWLHHHDFFNVTGMLESNVHFCYKRADKAPICKELGITAFIDDHPGCLTPMKGIVEDLIMFQEVPDTKHQVDKDFLLALGWGDVARIFLLYAGDFGSIYNDSHTWHPPGGRSGSGSGSGSGTSNSNGSSNSSSNDSGSGSGSGSSNGGGGIAVDVRALISQFDDDGNPDTAFLDGDHLSALPAYGCLDALAAAAERVGASNVYLIVAGGGKATRKSREWLESMDVAATLGIDASDNIIYCSKGDLLETVNDLNVAAYVGIKRGVVKRARLENRICFVAAAPNTDEDVGLTRDDERGMATATNWVAVATYLNEAGL